MERIILPPDYWEREYENHYAHRLERETARYAALAELISRWSAGRRVLDLGCGAGSMRLWLPEGTDYTGVDLSASALEQAARRPGGTFFRAEVETFQPHGRFDAVLFNECLYYLRDPEEILLRYAGYLGEDGAICVSIYHPAPGHRSFALLEGLIGRVERMDRCVWREELTGAEGLRWVLLVLK